jgi:hypothetical protein
MTTFRVEINVDPKGHVRNQQLWAHQPLAHVMEIQFVLEGGKEALDLGSVLAANNA